MLIGSARHYRFRNDNGSETSATWMAPEDTGAVLSLTPGQNKIFRLRWCFDGTVPPTGDDSAAIFLVSHNGGSPIGINTSTSYVKGAISSNISQAENTTNQLTVPPGETFATAQGCVSIATAQSTGLNFQLGQAIECEVALEAVASDLAANDTLDFTWTGFSFGSQTWDQYPGTIRLRIAYGSPCALLSNSRIPNIGFR